MILVLFIFIYFFNIFSCCEEENSSVFFETKLETLDNVSKSDFLSSYQGVFLFIGSVVIILSCIWLSKSSNPESVVRINTNLQVENSFTTDNNTTLENVTGSVNNTLENVASPANIVQDTIISPTFTEYSMPTKTFHPSAEFLANISEIVKSPTIGEHLASYKERYIELVLSEPSIIWFINNSISCKLGLFTDLSIMPKLNDGVIHIMVSAKSALYLPIYMMLKIIIDAPIFFRSVRLSGLDGQDACKKFQEIVYSSSTFEPVINNLSLSGKPIDLMSIARAINNFHGSSSFPTHDIIMALKNNISSESYISTLTCTLDAHCNNIRCFVFDFESSSRYFGDFGHTSINYIEQLSLCINKFRLNHYVDLLDFKPMHDSSNFLLVIFNKTITILSKNHLSFQEILVQNLNSIELQEVYWLINCLAEFVNKCA